MLLKNVRIFEAGRTPHPQIFQYGINDSGLKPVLTGFNRLISVLPRSGFDREQNGLEINSIMAISTKCHKTLFFSPLLVLHNGEREVEKK